jgi:hypothetical protein
VVEAAENCRNQFCIEAGGIAATCLKALPYLLMTLLCFAYMGLSSLCKEVPEARPVQSDFLHGFLKQKLCHENWELSLRTFGVIVIGSSFSSDQCQM